MPPVDARVLPLRVLVVLIDESAMILVHLLLEDVNNHIRDPLRDRGPHPEGVPRRH